MNTRRYPRTMAEAFGPYTSNELHPMPETRSLWDGIELPVLLGLLAAALFVIGATL